MEARVNVMLRGRVKVRWRVWGEDMGAGGSEVKVRVRMVRGVAA